MHHSNFISLLGSIYNPNVYVELGLYEGETLKKMIPYCKKIYGVDLKSNETLDKLNNNTSIFIKYCTTNDFFLNFNENIDMAFIDADHKYESVLVDFENVLKKLNKNGVIIIHDTDPISNKYIDPKYCGDSYKIVKELEMRDDINIITLPIEEAGLSIVTFKNSTRTIIRHNVAQ